MKPRNIECVRCLKNSPTKSVKYSQGVPLGPECYNIISRRETIRSGGPNPRMVMNKETGQFHTVSDYGVNCPSDSIHCFQCEYLRKETCPTEETFGDRFK